MRRIFLVIAFLLVAADQLSATNITWSDKIADDGVEPLGATEQFTHTDANAIKTAVNSKQDASANLTTWAGVTPSANGQSLVSAADYAAMRGLLDLEPGTDFNPYDLDIADLADGSLTGTKVGFADTDGLWTAINIQAALEELNDSINAGVPNGTGAKVHWSQITGMPAAFQDGTDDGSGTDDQTAAEVPVTDSGGFWTGVNVETILAEIGAKFWNAYANLTALKNALEDETWTLTQTLTVGTIVADEYQTSKLDGYRYSDWPNNTTIGCPGGGVVRSYNEAGVPKVCVGDTERVLLHSGIVDDTPSDGNTGEPASSNAVADHIAASATDSAAGHSELSTSAEINTGTDTGRTITPDALSGSNLGSKEIGWTVVKSDTATAVADGKDGIAIPSSINGMNLVDVTCSVADLNSAASGTTTVVIRRLRGGTAVDITSTGVTIDYNAYTASDETVDTTNDDVQTGDILFADVNAITTAAQKGLSCSCVFRLP